MHNDITAKWIWKKQRSYNQYNQTIIAKKSFSLNKINKSVIFITADSFYRLYINDQWVNDGPCRSWPEHYQYDEIDVTDFLRTGRNKLKVIARYYGTGTHHQVPEQAGLLAQLDIVMPDGSSKTIFSDDSWEIAEAKQWIRNTPKISFIMEPAEYYDARLENSECFEKAQVLYEAHKGPWQDLNQRDVALLTKKDFSLASFRGSNIVKSDGSNFCLAAAQLINPGIIEANVTVALPCGMAAVIKNNEQLTFKIKKNDFKVAVDGYCNPNGVYNLSAGKHMILAFVSNLTGVDKERTLRIQGLTSEHFENPLDGEYENPWSFIAMDEFKFIKDDLRWIEFPAIDKEIIQKTEDYNKLTDELLKTVSNFEGFVQKLQSRSRLVPYNEMFFKDDDWKFQERKVISDATDLVDNPLAVMKKNEHETVVRPAEKGDIELCYDFGEQNCGYYSIELEAEEGVHVDINAIEYITPNGQLQHTKGFRNGLTYITKSQNNKFISLKRRSGRYLFITFRNQKTPIKIKKIHLIESTYPSKNIGSFACSSQDLNDIWNISTRTLKLCMEDVFVDCPLYEQTLWVGDARNESLFAYSVFGSTDIAKRCIKLAAQSLEHFPIVGAQLPSCWQSILPAWSFLWSISVWDYYEYTADIEFLRCIHKDVIKNLRGAEKFIDNNGLFSCTFWNLFDWADIDWKRKKVVLHNSMILVGAIDAAVKCASVLEDNDNLRWLKVFREDLRKSINALWDKNKNSYPDSLNDDGTVSTSVSQHTSFLAVLFDIVEEQNIEFAIKNLIDPTEDIVQVGSPFAVFYLYQALEKLGYEDEIVNSIQKLYIPMLQAGATTVWESFATGTLASGQFPTRSHCHAWSSAPIYFLNRIILGVKQTKIGGSAYKISPRLSGLSWANGSVATVKGPIDVSWTADNGKVNINCSAPPGVCVKFERNDTYGNMPVLVNGIESN